MIPRSYRFGSIVPVLLFPLGTLTGMSAYQVLKHLFWPEIGIWSSHIHTVVFVTAVATVGGLLLCRYLEARSLLASIVQSSDDAIIGMTLEGIVFSWNRGAGRIYGYSEREMIGKHLSILIPPDRPEDLSHILGKIGNGMQVDHYETVRVRKDGKRIFLSLTVSPILNATGRILGASSINREITERKEAEAALRETEERLARTQAFSLVMVAHVGLDGRWLKVPASLCELLGYSKAEMLAQRTADATHPQDFAEEQKQFHRLIHGEIQTVDVEKRCCSRKGTIIWLYINYSIVTDSEGRPVHFLAYLRDVTRRRSAQEELVRYQTRLEELVEKRTRALTEVNSRLLKEIAERSRAEESLRESSDKLKMFAYSVMHDLKSPAIGIYGLTRRLKERYADTLDARGQLYCDQILKASEHVATLVEEINAFIAAKEAPIAIERVDLGEIVATVRNEFAERLKEHRIKWIEPESLGTIRADRMSLLRVFRNFTDNALKYGGSELSEIRLGCSESEDFHILSVTDDGARLEAGDCQRIFEVFHRAMASKGISGTGLGLAIVKEIAERHRGSVWVEPGRERGKTFCFSISRSL